jgi:regulator of protease activity HflC (stomatin/prohibitin superfamily)
MVKVDLRVMTMDVPPQDVITRDNISIKVNAVVYLKVVGPRQAILEVDQYYYATSQLAQTTLRSVCGEKELDTLLTERDQVNLAVQEILDKHTDPWGVKVTLVEVKQIDLPQEMQRAMAAQAEAERGRRAKIIHAKGEAEAAAQLAEAAKTMEAHPVTLQLRYLQTMLEVANEHNTTTVLPIPIDLIQGLLDLKNKGARP